MAQDITLLNASYSDVPAVLLPKTGGGAARFTDTSDATVDAANLIDGYTAHDASGNLVVGALGPMSNADIDSITGSSGQSLNLQDKTNIDPTTESQTITYDVGYDGLGSVQINAIPDNYIVPSGSQSITANGTYDVAEKESAVVAVPGWELLASGELTVNTTQTSAASAGTINCGANAWTADDIIFVRIRGKSGKRSGYFYGSDAIFCNYRAANESTSADATPAVEYIRVNSDGTYTVATGSYGVYAYSISSAGVLTIRRRYNSTNTLTINDTFDVEVYKLTLPDNKKVFD